MHPCKSRISTEKASLRGGLIDSENRIIEDIPVFLLTLLQRLFSLFSLGNVFIHYDDFTCVQFIDKVLAPALDAFVLVETDTIAFGVLCPPYPLKDIEETKGFDTREDLRNAMTYDVLPFYMIDTLTRRVEVLENEVLPIVNCIIYGNCIAAAVE